MESEESPPHGVPCTICGKYLSSYSSLCDHKRIHTGDRPHICQICNKRFTQKAHLMIHRRTHTGEKPYSCNICFKRFSQSSHLKNHKRIHTGEKAYICQICNMGFNQKPRLEKHLATHFIDKDGNPKIKTEKKFNNDVEFSDGDVFKENDELFLQSKQDFLDGKDIMDDEENADQEYFFNTDVKSERVDLPTTSGFNIAAFSSRPNTQSPQKFGGFSHDVMTVAVKDADKRPVYKASKRKPNKVKRIQSHDNENSDNDDTTDNIGYPNSFLKPDNASENTDIYKPEMRTLSIENNFSDEITALTKDSAINDIIRNGNSDAQVTSTENRASNSVSDDIDLVSNASESNYSSDTGGNSANIPSQLTSIYHSRNVRSGSSPRHRTPDTKRNTSQYIRTNNRICLVDFTTDDLLTHMMSRDDVHKCDFCCVIFQDQAMYHLHRSMHDKFDIRACNLCGKVSRDKHDFIAHFLSEHK